MHAVESTTWDDWGEEVEDPFEDAIVEAKREEGERLFDALDEIRIFTHDDIHHETFESPEEVAEAERIFDALVKEVHKRFYAYSAKLSYIEATHRDHA